MFFFLAKTYITYKSAYDFLLLAYPNFAFFTFSGVCGPIPISSFLLKLRKSEVVFELAWADIIWNECCWLRIVCCDRFILRYPRSNPLLWNPDFCIELSNDFRV